MELQDVTRHADPVHERAVRATEVVDDASLVLERDPAMLARDPRIGEYDVVVGAASDQDWAADGGSHLSDGTVEPEQPVGTSLHRK